MELHCGNNFLRLEIKSSWIHFQLDLSEEKLKVLAFEAILFIFSCMKVSLKLLLKLVDFKWEKLIILQLLKNVENFVNAPSMESCFSMPRFYTSFCSYQLNKYGSHEPWEAVLLKVDSDVFLNLDIAMKKKLVLHQTFLRKELA